MNNELRNTIDSIRKEAVTTLPAGKARRVSNHLDKVALILKRNTEPSPVYFGKEAIFQALCAGRHISQLNCREFRIEDVRTPVSHLAKRIEAAGMKLCTKKITSPVTGAWLKEYWLEKKEA